MKNKVEINNGAIAQCRRLMNGETIELNGLNTISVNRGDTTDQQFQDGIYKLMEENCNLQMRIERMGG